jgi:hypothetical protein
MGNQSKTVKNRTKPAKTTEKQEKPSETFPLRLEWRSPDELADNPLNWREHPPEQEAAMQGVLDEVGWAGAALYNELTGHLIDGHLRKKLKGVKKIPVLIGKWTLEQEAKILATLDPLSAMANANPAKLDELLRSFQTSNEAVSQMLASLAEKSGIIPLEDFKPATEDEQGELCDAWTVKCPKCGHEFTPSENAAST